MIRQLYPKHQGRLNTENFIRMPSTAITSIDYSSKLKLLEIEFRDNQKIYHYKNVEKDVYEELLHLKKLRESESGLPEAELEKRYSIGKFVNQKVKPEHDYYELKISDG